MITVNSWNEYDTLKTVILGNIYDINRVPYIYKDKDQESFQKIVEQTHIELANIRLILEQNNVQVLQPKQPKIYFGLDENFSKDLIAPINIRDNAMAYGKMFFLTYGSLAYRRYQHYWIEDIINQMILDNNLVLNANEPNIELQDWISDKKERWHNAYNIVFKNKNLLHTASILKHNKIAYISHSPGTVIGKKWITRWLLQQGIEIQNIKGYGHLDGTNSILNNDTIITIDESLNWNKFKNVIKIPNFPKLKTYNEEMIKKIKNPTGWLYEMQGHFQNFDTNVNALSINPNLVMLSFYNKDFYAKLKNLGIEVIYTEWKNWLWWGGGLHCITCDIERQE